MVTSEDIPVLTSDTEDSDTSVKRGALKVTGNEPQYSSSEHNAMIIELKESHGIYRCFFPRVTHTLPECSDPSIDTSSPKGK